MEKQISKIKYLWLRILIGFKIRRAERLSKIDKKQRFILNISDKYIIFTRIELKRLLKLKTVFNKGVTIEQLERKAIYKTINNFIK